MHQNIDQVLDIDQIRVVIDHLYDGVYVVQNDMKVIYWNSGMEKLTGYTKLEMSGRCCCEKSLIFGFGDCPGRCLCKRALKQLNFEEFEGIVRHKSGFRIPVIIRTLPLFDSNGKIIGAAEIFKDLSPAHRAQKKIEDLERIALRDTLTSLVNRRYLEWEINNRLLDLKQFGRSVGLVFMDIDHFKHINDSYGHTIGDLTLRQFADIARKNLRPSDTLGRWGGEEFVALILDLQINELMSLAERCRNTISKSFFGSDTVKFNLTVSLGVTQATETDTIESLVSRADALMYKSKRNGRNIMTAG
ncbi:sensor domain-containing diguanylate cyclase [bacterium]|nr:sensor domain-containing diguanylate cyclase [candidate division CSSED10-310 bacterium]